MHLATRILLLRVIDILMEVSLHRPIAAGRVGGEPPARVDGEVGRLLHGLHREITCRLEDDSPLATDPGDDGGPVFVIVAPTGLALLAPATRPASQRFLPARRRWPLGASGMVEVIGFHCPFQLAMHLVGERGIAEPPAPAIARSDVNAHFPGNASGRAGETEQKRCENPVRQGPLALVEQGTSEVVEGALAAVTPVAFASRSILVRAPASDGVTLASRTLQWTVLPPERMDVGLALVGVEEVVQMREYRHGCASPGGVKRVLQRTGDSHMFMPFSHSYKRR